MNTLNTKQIIELISNEDFGDRVITNLFLSIQKNPELYMVRDHILPIPNVGMMYKTIASQSTTDEELVSSCLVLSINLNMQPESMSSLYQFYNNALNSYVEDTEKEGDLIAWRVLKCNSNRTGASATSYFQVDLPRAMQDVEAANMKINAYLDAEETITFSEVLVFYYSVPYESPEELIVRTVLICPTVKENFEIDITKD